MHKRRKAETAAPTKNVTRWGGYLLLGAALCFNSDYSHTSGASASASAPVLTYLVERGINPADVKKHVVTPCCEIVVLKASSDAVAEVSGYDYGPGLARGTIRSEDGRVRGLVVITEESMLKLRQFEEDDLINGIPKSIRERMSAATRGENPRKVERLLNNIITGTNFEAGSTLRGVYDEIRETAGQQMADNFLARAIVVLTVSDYAMSKISDFDKSAFPTIMVHEAIHGAVNKFLAERNGRISISADDHERLAYLGELAYGNNPWITIYKMLSYYEFAYLSSGLREYGLEYRPTGIFSEDVSAQYVQFFHRLFYEISVRGGFLNPLDLIGKREDQLRGVGANMLEEESRRILGIPFARLISPEEIQSLRRIGAEYARGEYGIDR